jgi:hypothetical protein
MKMCERFLTVPMGTVAQAADLPSRKAGPVAYVKICDVYGRGFYYIPGTNTCLKVGGRVRFELGYRPATNVWVHGRNQGTRIAGRQYDTIGWRARAYVNMDARTQTAWGTVQTVLSVAVRSRSGIMGGSSTAGPQGSITASPQVYRAYIRFAGFTVGRSRRNFDFMPSTMLETNYWSSSSTGALQLAYTAVFGGGFSATIALEDETDFGYGQRISRITVVGTPAASQFPQRNVVLVGNLRVDQGWGSAQVMGAWLSNHNIVPVGANLVTVKKPGWAVGAGLKINLPMIAKGDALWLTAAYANGANDFTHSRYANGNTSKGRMMGGFTFQGANVTTFFPVAGVLAAELMKSWSVGAIYRHVWSPTLESNVMASYLSITPGARTKAVNWYTAGGIGNQNAWAVAHNLVWTPVRGFEISLELGYRKANNKLTAVGPVWGTAAAPNTIGVKQNPSMFYGTFRVERTF